MPKNLPNLLPRSKPLGSSTTLGEKTESATNLPDLKPVAAEKNKTSWEDEVRRNLRQSESVTLDQVVKDKQVSKSLNVDSSLVERSRDDAYKMADREEALKKLQNASGTRNYAAKGRNQTAVVKQDLEKLVEMERALSDYNYLFNPDSAPKAIGKSGLNIFYRLGQAAGGAVQATGETHLRERTDIALAAEKLAEPGEKDWTAGPGGALGIGNIDIPGEESDTARPGEQALRENVFQPVSRFVTKGRLAQAAAEEAVTPEVAKKIRQEDWPAVRDMLMQRDENGQLQLKDEFFPDPGFIESNISEPLQEWGRVAAEHYLEKAEENRPNVKPRTPLWYVTQAIEGVGSTMIPAFATTMATKRPSTGMQMMFGQVLGQVYGEKRSEGLNSRDSFSDALATAFFESASEGMPLGIMTRQGMTPVSKILKSGGAEGIQESANELAQVAYDRLKYDEDMSAPELLQSLFDAGVIGAIGGAGMGGIGAATDKITGRRDADIADENQAAAERAKLLQVLESQERAGQSEQEQSALDVFRQVALESEVKKADPETFAEITAEQLKAAEGTAPEQVHVSGDALIDAINADPDGIAPVLEKAGLTQEGIEEAHRAGGDIAIPMPQYLAHVVGTAADEAIRPHIKLHPESMSPAEREQWQQEYAEDAKRAINEAATARENDYQIDVEAAQIEQAIENELSTAADPASQRVVSANQRIWSSFFATMAKRGYLDNTKYQGSAWEAFKDFWPNVQKGTVADAQGQLLQNSAEYAGATEEEVEAARQEWQEKGTDSKYFQRWFGDSKVVDGQGQPKVVYHGTNVDFDSFMEGAQFFADNPDAANIYSESRALERGGAAMTVPAYLRIENPYYYDRMTEELDVEDLFGELSDEYDGIVTSDGHYIPFSPTQIKSATGNRGTFDPASPNILYQEGQSSNKQPPQPGNKFGIPIIKNKHSSTGAIYRFDNVHQLVNGLAKLGLDGVFIRWSRGPAYDQKQKYSIDKVTWRKEKGLSAIQIEEEWLTEPWYLVRKLQEYAWGTRLNDPKIRGWFYAGKKTGEDSDGYETISIQDTLGVIGEKLLDDIDHGLARYLELQDSIETDEKRLSNNPSGIVTKLVKEDLEKNRKEIKKYQERFESYPIPTKAEIRDVLHSGQPLFQGGKSPQGTVQFDTPSGQPLITLFETANESTFLHESGHVFLEALGQIANEDGASPELTQLWGDISAQIGHDPAAQKIEVSAHENWAKALEMYFREGQAPSSRLARAFQEFAAWLRRIYSAFTARQHKPSPELKAMFDRIFATDAEISEIEARNEASTPLFNIENMESETAQEYSSKQKAAQAQSRDEALSSYTRAYLRAQGGRAQAEAQAKDEASELAEYQASAEAVKMGGLNADQVREAIGGEGYKRLLKKRVGLVTKQGTVSPQTLADKYGYESSEDFLNALQRMESKTKFVRERTEQIVQQHTQRAREEFESSGLSPAQAAYHNDQRLQAILTELDVIKGQTNSRPVSEGLVRDTAKKILVEKDDIHNIDLEQFARQETLAAKKAKGAITQGNWEQAELWKTRQAINHAAILETRSALDGKTVLSRELLETATDRLADSPEAKDALEKIQEKSSPETKRFIDADTSLMSVLQDERADIYAKQKALEKHIREYLPKSHRTKAMHHIKNIARGKTASKRQGLLEYAMLQVEQAHQEYARKDALAKIDKLLKQKKPKRTKQGTQDSRRMDAEANKMVALVREARSMEQDQAMEQASAILEKMENGRESVSDEDINRLITYQTFGGLDSRSVVDAQNALAALQEIINTGRASWQAKEAARKEQNKRNRDQFLAEVTGGEGLKTQEQERLESQKGFFRKLADNVRSFDDLSQSFEMLLDKLARKDIDSTPLQSPTTDYFRRLALRATIREHAQTAARQEQLLRKIEEIFGKKGLARKLRENTQVVKNTGVTRQADSGRIEIPLSQNQAYKLWQLFQQPSILEELTAHGYDATTLEQVNEFMTPEVKEWARWQIESFYPEYREGINNVYREMFYVDMPNIEGYSPVSRVYEGSEQQDNEFLGERQGHLSSVLGSAVKTRVKNSRGFNILDGDSVLFQHITQMEHFKAWALPLREMRSVFSTEDVAAAIRQHHGKTANVALQSFMDRFATGGQERSLTLGTLDKLRRNFTMSVIGGNPVVFTKQLASIPAYAMEVPVSEFMSGVSQALANPMKAYTTLMESEAMQARYESGWDRDIKLAMRETSFQGKGKVQSFAEAMMVSTKLGDKFAIVAGGYSVYLHHYNRMLKQGHSKQEAKQEALHQFDITTKRSQQAGDVMDLSYFQGALGSLGKMFTMFMTAPLSYYRNSASALRNLAAGRGSRVENIKRLAVSWVFLQMVFQYIASGFEWEEEKQLRAALLGPLNGLFILRDVTDSLSGALIEGRSPYFSVGTPPPLTTISRASRGLAGVHKLIEEGGDVEDVAKTMNYLAESVGHLTGIPYSPMSRVYTGIRDAVTGETDYPVRRAMGYSEKRLKEANE